MLARFSPPGWLHEPGVADWTNKTWGKSAKNNYPYRPYSWDIYSPANRMCPCFYDPVTHAWEFLVSSWELTPPYCLVLKLVLGTSYWIETSPPAPLKFSALDQQGLPFSTTIYWTVLASFSVHHCRCNREVSILQRAVLSSNLPKDYHW